MKKNDQNDMRIAVRRSHTHNSQKRNPRTEIDDPENGQILATQEVSQNELEKLRVEHSAEVIRRDKVGVGNFPFLNPY